MEQQEQLLNIEWALENKMVELQERLFPSLSVQLAQQEREYCGKG